MTPPTDLPDRVRNKYPKLVVNFKQLRQKLVAFDNAHIDATANKDLFKEVRLILIDVAQIFKMTNGIQAKDDE